MQNRELLNKWKNKLLDTGKRNNLINFRNTKLGSVDVIYPNFSTIFSNVEHGKTFEVYDTNNDIDEVREYLADLVTRASGREFETVVRTSRDEYVREHTRTFKPNQILLFNSMSNPILTLRNIARNGRSAIEETGVNIVYMAFGFLNWAERATPNEKMKAPLLLVAVSIENTSALKPYYIKVVDTEVVVNPALAYKLKMDYNIDIPQYDEDSGEDIDVYLAKLEELFLPLGWRIDRDCKISTFSFLKINMYRDLQDNEGKVLQNESIQAILNTVYGDDSEEIREIPTEESREDLSLIPLHNVVDADSSQNEAVAMAATGKSFVLQGPPGTGKSQTITNIIAECLFQGKKVLFVSEKLAALQVVYEKLRRVGLEEFCLELHSHKSNKKAVIEELNATLRKGKSVLRDDTVNYVTAEYDKAKRELDEYVEELHATRPIINKSLYSIFDEISSYRNVPTIDFVIDDIKAKDDEFLRLAEGYLFRYCEFTPSIGYDYHANCWYGYAESDGTYAARMGVKRDISNTIELLRNLAVVNRHLNDSYQICGNNLRQMYVLRDFFRLISTSPFVTPSLLNATIYEIIEIVEELKVLADEINELCLQIDEVFDEEFYSYDGELIYKKLTRQFNSFGSRLFSREYRELVKSLKLYKKDGRKVNYEFAVQLFDILQVVQQKERDFADKEYDIKDILGSGYIGVATDFDRLLIDLNSLAEILADGVDLGSIRCMSEEVYSAEKDHFVIVQGEFERSFSLREESENKLFASFEVKECDIREMALEELEDKLTKCYADIDVLDNWCRFYKLLTEMSDIGLRDFVDLTIENEVRVDNIPFAYKKVFLWQWADSILVESERLNQLLRQWHDDRVNKFKRDDLILFEVNKAIIKSVLSQKRPDLDLIASGSAVAILQREGEKKSKHMSIRRLLNEIGELVQTLKPCFLMSPLSVSTFLSPDIEFDVVIFDEASQIFPQDVLGAIYRGKQLIVVGDEKQMPPSNFFNAIAIGEEDNEETEATDFESILNLCAAHFPERCLKWHYRSRHEQLIAFSNKYFYNNDLITFPSARCKTVGFGVDFCKVEGLFDHTTRTNRIEAEKVADLVFEHIERYPDRSLGVVAFSISQQNLIDRIILQRRRSDPSKEAFFSLDKDEPFFVKNLETVQGDERDTIIFSVAYGRDSAGRILANFGPINKEGGGRRLNVAVTRAKENVIVVASMSCTDLNLSNSNSQGARLLKAYLDFAENGMPALDRLEEGSPYEGYNSELENEIADFLRENGYEVDCQVGCSALKIDLALKNPDSGDYVLAIECDGRVYRSSRSTRDRDRLRQQVLERMGWKYYRIWSTDWFRNKDNEKRRLLEAVRQAFDEVVDMSDDVLEELGEIDDSFVEEVVEDHFDFPIYVSADVLGIVRSTHSNKMRVIKKIVEIESPISSEWLLSRILFLFGTSLTATVRKEYESLVMNNCQAFGIRIKNGFLFNNEVSYPMLRIPDGEDKRNIEYIPIEELANGLVKVIELNVTITKEDLFSYIRARLGFRSLTERIRFRLEKSLQLLIDSGKVLVDEDKLSLR